jgi:hypothetical protein
MQICSGQVGAFTRDGFADTSFSINRNLLDMQQLINCLRRKQILFGRRAVDKLFAVQEADSIWECGS